MVCIILKQFNFGDLSDEINIKRNKKIQLLFLENLKNQVNKKKHSQRYIIITEKNNITKTS